MLKDARSRKQDEASGTRLPFEMLPQPDNTTCGPTCLHAVYSYYGDNLSQDRVIAEVPMLEDGGTLAVFLACHALRRGYKATIYTYNLQAFDPTWFVDSKVDLPDKLRRQLEQKPEPRLEIATHGYLEFLELGGAIRFADLTTGLIRKHLTRQTPILTGLSATYLYRSKREFGPRCEEDDVRGQPVGHFVVLCGYEKDNRRVLVADPMPPDRVSSGHVYSVDIDRVLGAILLGVITYDANLLVLTPASKTMRT